jgi:tRNA pseudouridine38-40 synthase
VRWRLTLAYRGEAYAGWQRQENALGVQQVVEEALAAVLPAPVRVVGASRTDAGVHARGQVASLELSGEGERPGMARRLVHGVNARLPADVRVLAAAPAPAGFHARKDAIAKEYRYHLRRADVLSPLDAPFAVRVDPRLDLAAMHAATDRLPGRHDFTAFAKLGGAPGDPWRRIDEAEWLAEADELTFRIVGEGFLRGMVRALVGTLLEVGRGRRSPASFADLLAGASRSAAGPNAPARGLVLQRVDYPPAIAAGAAGAGAGEPGPAGGPVVP